MNKSTIEKAVQELNSDLAEVNERRSELMDSIKQMQKMCEHTEHEYEYDGSTSHDTRLTCIYCGSSAYR